jgi:hypothetical protein
MHIKPILTTAWFSPLALGGMLLAIAGGLVLHLISNRVLIITACCGSLLSALLFALIPDPSQTTRSTKFLYWAYIFPAMCGSTIGADITFNVTNVFITTSMARRHQAAASGIIMSVLCLGIVFWLGVAQLAVSIAMQTRGDGSVGLRVQYQVGFWIAVGLAVMSFGLLSMVKMGQAGAAMTADERETLGSDGNRS